MYTYQVQSNWVVDPKSEFRSSWTLKIGDNIHLGNSLNFWTKLLADIKQ